MAIDDYDWRTKRCVSTVKQTYHPSGKGEQVTVSHTCVGTTQFRRKGTEPWKCALCGKCQSIHLKLRRLR